MLPLSLQLIHLCAALMLLLAFVFLIERRLLQLTLVYQMQGVLLCFVSVLTAFTQQQPELYGSAIITLVIKVILIPIGLRRLMHRLALRWDRETMVNVPTTLLLALALVLLAFDLTHYFRPLTSGDAGQGLSIALACVLLALLMMIARTQALSQVIGFLAMENALMFAATVSVHGMPMIVELGMALDVLVGLAILGVFMSQMRTQFESLDIQHLERMKDRT